MNKLLFQQITFFSSILGGLLALVTLIPIIGQLAFWVLMCFASAIVILFMMKLNLIEFSEIKESVVVGAIIGGISYIAFSIIYIPLVILLLKVFGWYTNYGVAIVLSSASVGMIIVLTGFLAVLSATVNAFFAFVTFYVTEVLKKMNTKNDAEEDKTFKL